MSSKIAPSGAQGNMRLLKAYGGGSTPPRQAYADGGAVNPSLDEGLSAAGDMGKSRPGKGKDGKDKKEAKVNINVIVAAKDKDAAPAPAPTGAAGLAPPPPMPMPPPAPMAGPPPGPMPGPGMPMRAAGGRVKREDGGSVKKSSEGWPDPITSGRELVGSFGRLGKLGKAMFSKPEERDRLLDEVKKEQQETKERTGSKAFRANGGPVKAPTTKGMLAEKGHQGGGGGGVGRLEKIKDMKK